MRANIAMHGTDITRLARLVADRNGRDAAIKMLVSGIEGMTVEIATRVISGEDEITGATKPGMALQLRSSLTPLAIARDRYTRRACG